MDDITRLREYAMSMSKESPYDRKRRQLEEIKQVQQRVEVLHQCQCGWKRWISNNIAWRTTFIEHPYHGWMTQMQAAETDIATHNCDTWRAAVKRSPRAQAIDRGEDLPEYALAYRVSGWQRQRDHRGRFAATA